MPQMHAAEPADDIVTQTHPSLLPSAMPSGRVSPTDEGGTTQKETDGAIMPKETGGKEKETIGSMIAKTITVNDLVQARPALRTSSSSWPADPPQPPSSGPLALIRPRRPPPC